MVTADPKQVVADVLAQYGVIKEIPEAVLQEKQLKVIHDPQRGTYQLVTMEKYTTLVSNCWVVMKRYEGYIFAHNLSRLYQLVHAVELMTEEEIAEIGMRARKFIEAGIPPIFRREWYGRSFLRVVDSSGAESIYRLFPSVDFVIEFATGAYDRNRIGRAIELREAGVVFEGDKRIPIQPATVQDVLDFRHLAFTSEGKIDSRVIRETLLYVREHFRFLSSERAQEVVEMDHQLFLFLEEQLAPLQPEPHLYRTWDGSRERFKHACWYLRHSPEEVNRMAEAYFDGLPDIPAGTERKFFTRMELLFPSLAQQWHSTLLARRVAREDARLREAVSQAQAAGDFSSVPPRALLREPWRIWAIPLAQEYLRQKCRELRQSRLKDLMKPLNEIPLGFHNHLLKLPHFGDVVTAAQLETVEQMDTDTFRELFSGRSGYERYKSFQISTATRKRTDIVGELRRALKVRYQHVVIGE